MLNLNSYELPEVVNYVKIASSHNDTFKKEKKQQIVNYVKITSSHNTGYAMEKQGAVVNYVKITSSHNIGWYKLIIHNNIQDY